MLAFLSSVAKGVPQKLEVMCQLVSSLFDLNPNISSYMKVCVCEGGGLGGKRDAVDMGLAEECSAAAMTLACLTSTPT